MYAVFEFRTNNQGVMQIVDPVFRTDNAAYAESKVHALISAAVGSAVYVHTILCVDEHGQTHFDTPKYYEHIPTPEPEPEPEEA